MILDVRPRENIMPGNSNTLQFYPELRDTGSLTAALSQAFKTIGSSLTVSPSIDLPNGVFSTSYAHIERGVRFSQTFIAAEERLFLPDFWAQGVMMASGGSPDLLDVAAAIDCWISGGDCTLGQIETRFAWVKRHPDATAFEEGRAVEQQWDWICQRAGDLNADLPSFVRLAYGQPRLRELFPFTSLCSLNFSRCTGYPFDTDGMPFIWPGGSGLFRVHVHGKSESDPVGMGNAETAIQMVLEHLPPNTGPARPGTADGQA